MGPAEDAGVSDPAAVLELGIVRAKAGVADRITHISIGGATLAREELRGAR